MVADGAGVALFAVAAAARAQLGGGARRRQGQAGGAHRAEQQRPLVGAVERGRLPAVEQRDHRVDVVDLELAADVGAAEAELARGAQHVGGGARRADAEGGPVAAWSREASMPSQNSTVKGRSGSAGFDLAAQRSGVGERHRRDPTRRARRRRQI